MTASRPNPSLSWDRVLPAPDALLNGSSKDVLPRRSSSLLQHHLFSSKDRLEGQKDRRSTVPSISYQVDSRTSPVPPIPPPRCPLDISHPTQLATGALTRKRAASLMADESTPRETSPAATQGSIPESTNQFCLCQPDPKIPRPRNAFILYRQHHQAAVVAKHPGLPNPDISKIIGEEWRALPTKTKNQWKALAEEEKLRHQQQYPDYRYQPRRLGRNGNIHPLSSSNSTGSTGKCFRCGGKTMNPPSTPHTPLFSPTGAHSVGMIRSPSAVNAATTQTPRRPHPLAHASLQRQMPYTISSPPPPGSALTRFRPFNDVFPGAATPSISEADYRARFGAQPLSPDPKRRRFNGPAVIVPARAADLMSPTTPYPQDHSYSPRRISLPRPSAVALHPVHQRAVTQAQTARPSHPPQHPRYASVDARDPSLTLAPLRTPNSATTTTTSSARKRTTTAAGAQIMSLPIMNKLRLISKAAPALPYPTPMARANPGRSTSTMDTRGAILAIEGSDRDVRVVTDWLTEFLKNERDAFCVRVFHGPDISAVMAREDGEGGTDKVGTHHQRYLQAISDWHGVSHEVVKFVTTGPEGDSGSPAECNSDDTTDGEAQGQRETEKIDVGMDLDSTSSPTSAISPRTIIVNRAQKLGLQSPINKCSAAVNNIGHDDVATSPPPPRIVHSPSPSNQGHKKYPPFPVALLPRYQLSTVDTASLTMPITDSYLPIDHWQWAAALWRGCVGADVTIVVQDDQFSSVSGGSSNGSIGPTAGSGADSGGVEVQLGHGDVRAVIVRKGVRNGSEKKAVEAGALRRLGFEIVEFLRR